MIDTISSMLLTACIIEDTTRINLKDGRTFEGVVSIYNQSNEQIVLTAIDTDECLPFEIHEIEGIQIISNRSNDWSL